MWCVWRRQAWRFRTRHRGGFRSKLVPIPMNAQRSALCPRCLFFLHVIAVALLLVGVGAAVGGDPAYETRQVEGWTVHIDLKLLVADSQATTAKALELLQTQLKEVVRVVPRAVVARLREVPLWVSLEYAGIPPRAE